MLHHFKALEAMAKQQQPKRMVVVFPHDLNVLEAVLETYQQTMIKPVFIGDEERIHQLINIGDIEIIHETDPVKASKIAMDLVNHQQVDILMKGLIDTHDLLKAVVNDQYGIKKAPLLSHVGLLEYPDFNRILYVTDGAMNINPTVEEKIVIIENVVDLAHRLGDKKPKVGLVSAVEKINPKMKSTTDAQLIIKHYETKHNMFDIDGPFAIDNLVSLEAVKHKGLKGPVAGQANILVFPNIESGNVFYKTSVFLANAKSAGIVLGAKVPIVLTSRADSKDAKLNAIYLSVVMS